MRKNEIVKLGEREIIVNELTVTQIDKVFGEFDINRKAARAEMLIDSNIPIEVVTTATGLKDEELNGEFTPSELNMIWEAVARVNDFLSKMMDRLSGEIDTLSKDVRQTRSPPPRLSLDSRRIHQCFRLRLFFFLAPA